MYDPGKYTVAIRTIAEQIIAMLIEGNGDANDEEDFLEQATSDIEDQIQEISNERDR